MMTFKKWPPDGRQVGVHTLGWVNVYTVCQSSSKHNFTVSLEPPKFLFLIFLQMRQKKPKDIKKIWEQRPDMKTALSNYCSHTFAENYFMNFSFFQNWHFVYVYSDQNTILT